MSIINIGSKLDKIQAYIEDLELFEWVYAWKPITEPTGVYLWFEMVNNSPKLWDDSEWTLLKEWLFNFHIVSNDKNTPDVVLYEKLDELSNELRTMNKDKIILDDFEIWNIEEANQSGVLKDIKENPYIIAQYTMIYKYRY